MLHKLTSRIATHLRHAAVARALGAALGAAAKDDKQTMPRRCPVCESAQVEERPALVGPVYPFHRCRGCSLLYVRRPLRPDVQRKLYAELPAHRAHWEVMRDDAAAQKGTDAYAPLAARLVARAPSTDVCIDVGCHFGGLLAALAPRFKTAFGLELNRRTAEAGAQLHAVEIRCERLENLKLAPGSVDLIVMNQVLEHVLDVRTIMGAAARLLKPRGVLWIGLPHGASLGMRVLGGAHPFATSHGHVNLFTTTSLKKAARNAGFAIATVGTEDDLDLSLADWMLDRLPEPPPTAAASALGALLAPALAVDRAARILARRTKLPSRFGVGGHLDALLVKPHAAARPVEPEAARTTTTLAAPCAAALGADNQK